MTNKTVRMRHNESMMRVPTRDALLTTPTPEESAANARRVAELTAMDLGRVWDGFLRAANPSAYLDLLPVEVRDELLAEYGEKAQALTACAKASGTLLNSPDLNFIADDRAKARDAAGAAGATRHLIRAMNASAECLWNQRGAATSVRDRAAGSNIAAINRANETFWNAGR